MGLLARSPLGQYLVITGNYWAFTLSDGALRMLVLLYFHELGYGPLALASLFLFYEFFGVITNLIGGWLGARIGLNRTMHLGLGLQLFSLCMLLAPTQWLVVPWVMAAQALSGVAKDLNKMSAKSAIKAVVPVSSNTDSGENRLFRYVAWLTGSKNALKGIGFFLGGALLSSLGFQGAVAGLALLIAATWMGSIWLLKGELGKAKNKPKFTDVFSKSQRVNLLSAARFFLFAARDVWFVVALPVTLASSFGWGHWQVGAFLACWIVAYGAVQAAAPLLFKTQAPNGRDALIWVGFLALSPALIALALGDVSGSVSELTWLLAGLLLFGALFAVNSSLHSFLIVHYADAEGVSLDVGFYYMANAAGRLVGTLLSGMVYQLWGLSACLWTSFLMLLVTAVISLRLSRFQGG